MVEVLISIGVLVIFAIGAVIRENGETRVNKKECEQYIQENREITHSDSKLFSTIFKLENDVPPCQKCGWAYMQLWSYSHGEFTYRCTQCKKQYNLNEKTTPNKIYDLRIGLDNLYLLLDKIIQHIDDRGWEKLRGQLIYDYFSLRKGTPFLRAIEFEGSGTLEIKQEIRDSTPSRRITQKVKDMVWRRDEGRCVDCGSNENLEFDHIIPHSKGGANTYRNIQLLCEPCNRKKSNVIG